MNVVRLFLRQQVRNVASYKTNSKIAAEQTVEEEFKSTIQRHGATMDKREWIELRNRVMANKRFYSKVNVDATILGLCNKHGSVEVGRSYINFLEENHIPITAAIAGKYLKLFELPSGEKSFDEDVSGEILRVYKLIREKYPVLDNNTAEHLIHAICLTGQWKDSYSLLEQIKEFGTPSHATFNDIAQSAFRNGEPEEGIKILEEGIAAGRLPSGGTLIEWIKTGSVQRLLPFLQHHNLQIPESVATNLKNYLENEEKIPVTMSSVSRNKMCGSCGTHLDEITILPEEFKQLQDAFHEKVLIKDNIFIKSTPQEFHEFQQFLEQTGPFDCIIDGLNVAYSVGANRPVNHLSGHILAAMKYFTQQNKRVLILGREHMKRWPSFLKKVTTNNGEAFLTENLTQDDPFFIYAALKSGPNCGIFTRDLLRTHAHQLGPELGAIFRRWQRVHQFSYKSPTTSTTPKLFVQPPIKYKIEAHRNSSGYWHVPWTEEGHDYAVSRIPEVPFEVPVRWMCFKK